MASLEVAKTILEQLGGARFIRMTGARAFVGDSNNLRFRLPNNAKNSINCVRITLDPSDTYTVIFYHMNRAPRFDWRVVSKHADIYWEDLQKLFTQETGLYTHL